MTVEYLGPGYQGNKYLGEQYKVGNNKFYVYFPKSVGNDSSIKGTLYYAGKGGYSASTEANILTEMYNNENIDFAYISPTNTSGGVTDETINSLLDYIKDPSNGSPYHYDIDISNVGGFSLGGAKGTKDFVNMLHTEYANSDSVEQKNLLLYDPYGYGTDERPTYSPTFTNEDIQLMEKNHSQVVFFTTDSRVKQIGSDNNCPIKYANDSLTKLAQSNGISPIIISGNIVHNSMSNEINRDGWRQYFEGTIGLEDIQNGEYIDSRTGQKKVQDYHVIVPIKDDNNNVIWQSYKLSDLVAAKKNPGGSNQDILSALNYVESTVIKTDFNYVDKANELIMEINKFHQDSSTALSFVSKSSLLPQENTMLNAIAKVLSNLQISCVAEIKNILYAGSAYESLDKALALDAEKFSNVLNENIQSYKVPMVTLNDTGASNLNNVKLYTTNDLMNKSVYDRANLTADEINMIIDSELKGRESVLSGTGKYWIEASNKTGLDPLFLLALARQESGLGTSKYAINYNNFFGLKYQNGVQYFGKNRNGVYVERMYADNPGEGIIKGSEWIKECYVEQCGGNTTRKFGNTGYNGGYNYGTVLSSIMGRMGNTYQSVTGNPISFIDASSSGNYVMSTASSTEYTIPSQVSNSTQTINSVYAPMSSSSINYSANSTSSNTQTFSSTQSSQPISGFVQNSQPVSGSVQSSQPIPENINAGTMVPFNKPDVTSETEMVSESNVIPNSNITSSLDSTTSPDIAPETETILKPTEEIETETIVSPNSTVKPETSTKSDSIPENNTYNNTNNNPILSSVGIIAGVGAVAAASVYGAKKIKDKADENNEV